MKVLVCPDKFKGTLSAAEAAQAIASGWKRSRPADQLELLPISDGGDGFGELISSMLGATPKTSTVLDAAHRPIDACWWWHPASRTAVIESARVIGLAQLPLGKYHPFELDTEGLGLLLREVAREGARRCLIGIGGSATNDAGFGMARALDWQFFNKHSEKIDRWPELHALAEVRPPEERNLFEELIVAVDVQNPLLGPNGCTRVYGPQKGLCPDDFEFAERCLERVAELLLKELHLEGATQSGAGAAGGLGFGLHCFVGGRLAPGFALFAEQAKLVERIRSVDLVITGEGALDGQTLMGKGVGELAEVCKAAQVPCIAMAGIVPDARQASRLFHATYALTPSFTTRENALNRPAEFLERLSAQAGQGWVP